MAEYSAPGNAAATAVKNARRQRISFATQKVVDAYNVKPCEQEYKKYSLGNALGISPQLDLNEIRLEHRDGAASASAGKKLSSEQIDFDQIDREVVDVCRARCATKRTTSTTPLS